MCACGAAVTAGAVCGAASLLRWNNKSIVTTEYEIGSPRVPEAFDGFRIVQVSDLQSEYFGLSQSSLLRAVRNGDPDIIVITGDLIDRNHTDYMAAYQAVSGAGQAGLEELERELRAHAEGESAEPRVFPAPIAMNLIPMIGSLTENGYTDEEMKMQNEGRRILHAPELLVNCSCVRVPVLRSHAIALTVETADAVSPEEARAAIRSFPGVRLALDEAGRDWPTPLDTTGGDPVWVGRIRRDYTRANSLSLFCCGDQIRKGAAANAVQILRLLTE